MRRWVYRILLAIPLLALATWLVLPNANWDGAVPRQVRLHVVDAKTSSPVTNASVSFNGRAVGSTDANGDVSWTAIFGAGGSRNIIKRGHWIIDGDVTVTDATGHSTTVALPSLVPQTRLTLWNKGPVEATVKHGG
jgi:hypothetical protein